MNIDMSPDAFVENYLQHAKHSEQTELLVLQKLAKL